MTRAIYCIIGMMSGTFFFMSCVQSNTSGPAQTSSAFDTVNVHISGALGCVQFSPQAGRAFSIGSAGSVDSAYVFPHGQGVLCARDVCKE